MSTTSRFRLWSRELAASQFGRADIFHCSLRDIRAPNSNTPRPGCRPFRVSGLTERMVFGRYGCWALGCLKTAWDEAGGTRLRPLRSLTGRSSLDGTFPSAPETSWANRCTVRQNSPWQRGRNCRSEAQAFHPNYSDGRTPFSTDGSDWHRYGGDFNRLAAHQQLRPAADFRLAALSGQGNKGQIGLTLAFAPEEADVAAPFGGLTGAISKGLRGRDSTRASVNSRL